VAKLTGVFLLGGEKLVNLLTNFAIGNLNIVLGLTIIGHQRKKTIIGDIELLSDQRNPHSCPRRPYQLVFLAGHVGDIHVVGGGAEFFELLASEDIDGDEMDLGVTVLASLGG
jgi:hypothetical protein